MDLLLTYIGEVWDILLEASPYVLFGFFVAGLLKAFLPSDFVARHLGKGRYLPVFKASLFGIPLPLCSCGVIPAAAGLRQQGASKGATTSFMISTPETGVDSIAITYALLDPLMTIVRPVAAFLSATTAGLLVDNLKYTRDEDIQHDSGSHNNSASRNNGQPVEDDHPSPSIVTLDRFEPHMQAMGTEQSDTPHVVESCSTDASGGCGCGHDHAQATPDASLFERFMGGMRFAFGELVGDIGKWLIIGILLAAVISLYLPVSFIETYVGDGMLGMLIMVVAGIPMYVCATASTPIAAALALKGLSPGAALVFLLAGPATNAATITVVAKTLGKRVAAVYVGAIAVVAILLGVGVNWLYSTLGLSISGWVSATEVESHGIFAVISTVVLLGLVAWQLFIAPRHNHNHGHDHGCGCDSGSCDSSRHHGAKHVHSGGC